MRKSPEYIGTMALLYYNPHVVAHESNLDVPGIRKFSHFFGGIFGPTMVIVDRTNTISLPINVVPHSLIPKFRPMHRSFEELCNERAKELLARSESLNTNMYTLWSGGIDSTLVLVSLLKNASADQKKRIIVLLSEESIAENPRFYTDHIHGKLRREVATKFPYILGTNDMFVSGELNDQLFGAAAPNDLMLKYGIEIAHKPFARDVLFSFFDAKVHDAAVVDFYLDLFDRVLATAPVPITSYFDYFWWLNFTLKWQSVYFRILSFTAERNAAGVTAEYVRTHFEPFYDTTDFQLWSMNNLDKRMRDTWNTYKWVCKDIIFDYTRDAAYRDNKVKRGSLYFILLQQNAFNFIDEEMRLLRSMDRDAYYRPNNDFV